MRRGGGVEADQGGHDVLAGPGAGRVQDDQVGRPRRRVTTAGVTPARSISIRSSPAVLRPRSATAGPLRSTATTDPAGPTARASATVKRPAPA